MKNVEFAHSAFTTAERYERGRSGYPPEAVSWLVEVLGIDQGTAVVDLAAGTGKFTRLLVAPAGQVVAVEPVAAMRAELARVVPKARVLGAAAEAIPLRARAVQAITVAQAFHWFDPARALPEMHRILRPGGRVGLIWNRADTSVPWVARLDALRSPNKGRPASGSGIDVERLRGELRHVVRLGRRKLVELREGRPKPSGDTSEPWWVARCREGFRDTPLFEPLELKVFRHTERMDADRLVDWVASFSRFSKLSPSQQEGVVTRVRDLARRELASEFDFPYRTDVFTTTRRAAGP